MTFLTLTRSPSLSITEYLITSLSYANDFPHSHSLSLTLQKKGRSACILLLTAGREGLKLARSLEKDTYKLEAHHRHLRFTHRALENSWFPKSLRFHPPGNHRIFRQIMERASKHCMKATISICHDHIKSIKNRMNNTRHELAIILPTATLESLNEFLKQRALSVCDTIKGRHQKKLDNLRSDYDQTTNVNRSK